MTDLLSEAAAAGTSTSSSSSALPTSSPPTEVSTLTSSSVKEPPCTDTVMKDDAPNERHKLTYEEEEEFIKTLQRKFSIFRTETGKSLNSTTYLVWMWKEGIKEMAKLIGAKAPKVQRKDGKKMVRRKKVNLSPWSIKENHALITEVHPYKDCLQSIDWTRISRLLTMKEVAERFRPKDFLSPENCSKQYKLLVEMYGLILPEQDMRETIADRLERYFDGEINKIKEQEISASKLKFNKLTQYIKDMKTKSTAELLPIYNDLVAEMHDAISEEEIEIDDNSQPQLSLTKPALDNTNICDDSNLALGDAKIIVASDVEECQSNEIEIKKEESIEIDIDLPLDTGKMEAVDTREAEEPQPELPVQPQPGSPEKAIVTPVVDEKVEEYIEQEPSIEKNEETQVVSVQTLPSEPPEEVDIKPDLVELNLLIANSLETTKTSENVEEFMTCVQESDECQPPDKVAVAVDKFEVETTLDEPVKPLEPISSVEEISETTEIDKVDKPEVEKSEEKVIPAKEIKGRVDTKLKVEITPLPDIILKKEVIDASLVKETDLGTPTSSSPALSEKSIKADEQNKLFKRSVLLLHGRIAGHKHASLFHKPVRKESAPQYYLWIKQPVDLATIKRRIETGEIITLARYERDLALMFLNAIMYNTNNPDITEITYQMEKDVKDIIQDHKITQQLLLVNYDSDDTQSSRKTRRRNSSVHTPEQIQKQKRTRTTSKLVTSDKQPRKSTSSGVEEVSSPGNATAEPTEEEEEHSLESTSEKKTGKSEKKTKGKRGHSTVDEDSPQQDLSSNSNSTKGLSIKIGRTTRRTAGTL